MEEETVSKESLHDPPPLKKEEKTKLLRKKLVKSFGD